MAAGSAVGADTVGGACVGERASGAPAFSGTAVGRIDFGTALGVDSAATGPGVGLGLVAAGCGTGAWLGMEVFLGLILTGWSSWEPLSKPPAANTAPTATATTIAAAPRATGTVGNPLPPLPLGRLRTWR